MNKKCVSSFAVTLVLLLLLGVMGACSAPAPTPTPTSSQSGSTPTPTPTSSQSGSTPSATAGPPLKIGVVLPFTGALASNAATNMNGIEYYFDSIGNQVAGRPVQLIKKDSKSTASDALTVTKELVEQDHVDAIIGYVNSSAALAVRDYLTTNKVPTLVTTAGADDLTESQASPYIFRTANNNEQEPVAMAPWVYQHGYHNIITIGSDYAAGHEMADAFKWAFEQQGGHIVDQIFTPITTTDYGPNLTAIQQEASKADAVWGFVVGPGQVQFVKQYQQFGLGGKLQLMGQGGITSENLLSQLGDSALGVISGKNFTQAFGQGQGTPQLAAALDKWQSDYAAKYNQPATGWTLQAWMASQAYAKAVEGLNGNTSNSDQAVAAIAKVTMEGPLGNWTFDDKHQAIFPVFIRKVEKVNGNLETVAIDTIPNVGQTVIPSQ